MDYILLLFIIVFFIKSRFHFKDNNENYISRKQTQCINGFFVLIVFLRHFKSYIKFGDFDHIFQAIDGWTGQLIVVPFLFFSGYGIMLSISKKGTSYVNSVITKRFPKVWIHFMMAIVLFVFTNMYLGNKLDIYKVLFSLIVYHVSAVNRFCTIHGVLQTRLLVQYHNNISSRYVIRFLRAEIQVMDK